ncbi:hypothetical protein CAPTEDRAFT_191327 [Capitella teleta]|uniref:Uncharacterized protein n=1 Tax=Capitella teleta TaxID=283909 RepID=R7U7F9_CAPTE|nr:hypothetical protein CAPTEDRAFT_191327 [Capitella teleta]|eukprot:ELU01899.1 hypothetical protein CAPTEDRAFT_191327 [Capitella teleta]
MKIHHLLWLLVCLANFEERLCGEVNLRFRHLTSVPEDITHNVTSLFLDTNDIKGIRQTDFNEKYQHLIWVSLKLNRITFIESGCFKGTILERLQLNSIKLTSIPDLREVSNTLTELYLGSNPITTIRVDDLSYLTQLNILGLNGILSTLHDVTQLMPSLQVLDLQQSPLNRCCSNLWLKQIQHHILLGSNLVARERLFAVVDKGNGFAHVKCSDAEPPPPQH